jgi:plastocyanin
MSIRTCVVALCAAVAVAVACESRQSLPVSPSVSDQGHTISADSPAQFAAKPDQGKTVTLMDACDPETFNAPVPVGAGPGTCVRQGGVRFSNFLDELARKHSVGAWHMAPGQVTIKLGDVLSAFNNGGEVHTFTEVDEFGGGFVQPLNDILGLAEIPECAQAQASGAVLKPGESSHEVENDAGVEKYQCCIHPWMRAEVRIVAK